MSSAQPDPDRELILACQSGDEERFEAAFEELYARYKDRVYSIAYRITGRSADAMDVAQECFSLLFRKIDQFRFDSLFSTWLFRLVVNCSIDCKRHARSRGLDRTGSLDRIEEFGSVAADGSPGPDEVAAGSELEAAVHLGMQKLSPKLRAILVLRYLEGLSYEALASTLQVSIGTVKSRLARAHLAIERVLRRSLVEHDYPIAFADGPGSGIAGQGRAVTPDQVTPDQVAPEQGDGEGATTSEAGRGQPVGRRRPKRRDPGSSALLLWLVAAVLAAGSLHDPLPSIPTFVLEEAA